MQKTITGVLIAPDLNTAEKTTLRHNLHDWYEALDCELIDIASRRIGERETYFDIICDDEGLLRTDPLVGAFDTKGHPMLVGRLFVCRNDGHGENISLTDDECEYVLEHIGYATTFARPGHLQVCLTDVAY